MAAAIETHGLTKTYAGDVRAVAGLELRVEPGEVFGYLGPNGAGKSTTIRMLLDLIRCRAACRARARRRGRPSACRRRARGRRCGSVLVERRDLEVP